MFFGCLGGAPTAEPVTAPGGPSVGRRLARDLVVTTAGSLATRVVAAAAGVLIARLLGPADRGRYAVLFLAATLFGAVGTLGLEVWVAREVAQESITTRTTSVIKRHIRAVGAATMGLSLVLASIGGRLEWTTWQEVAGAALVALSLVVSVIRQAVLQGLRLMRRLACLSLLGAAAYLAWVLALSATHRRSVALVLLGAATANAVQIVVTFHGAAQSGASRQEPARLVVRKAHRKALRFGLPSTVGIGLSIAAYRLDLLVVAVLTTSKEVGLYSAALGVAELLLLVPNALSQVLLPHVSSKPKRQDTPRLVRVSAALMLVPAIGVAALAVPLITGVYGREYRGAAVALPPLALASVVLGAWKLLMIDLLARGHPRFRATTAATGLGAMLAADAFLVPLFGIAGAGVGSLVGYSVSLVHVAMSWRRHADGSLLELLRVRAGDVRALTTLLRRP